MPAKASRRGGNDKRLQSEIESKRGEIHRLQNKFSADSERHKYLVTYQENLVKYIQDLKAQNAQLEERYETDKKSDQEQIQRAENEAKAGEIASRGRLRVALEHRLTSLAEAQRASADLARFEATVADKVRIYKELIAKRRADVEEAERDLALLQEQSAPLLSRVMAENPEQLALPCSFEGSDEEDEIDDLARFEAARARMLLSTQPLLRSEEAKLNKKIESFRQLKQKLELQISALTADT
jgi:hypothetical protein